MLLYVNVIGFPSFHQLYSDKQKILFICQCLFSAFSEQTFFFVVNVGMLFSKQSHYFQFSSQ